MKTPDEINRILAERIMKYENIAKYPEKDNVYLGYGGFDWHPYSNLEQAMMCLEKFDEYQIKRTKFADSRHFFTVELKDTAYYGNGNVEQPLFEVICLAIMKALGEE